MRKSALSRRVAFAPVGRFIRDSSRMASPLSFLYPRLADDLAHAGHLLANHGDELLLRAARRLDADSRQAVLDERAKIPRK